MTVYKSYNREQLNNQYNNRLHVPDYADYFERWEKLSRQIELKYPVVKDISFGDLEGETIDIFPARKTLTKTMVFIHGGYWHLLDKAMFHFLAAPFLNNDITTVFINYPLAPKASMDTIVHSCGNAMLWLHANIMRFNGDPSQVYVMGHSAGAHLAAMLLIDDDINFIKGAIALSGLFRLEPILFSNINDVLRMDMETAARNSPVHTQPVNRRPLLLATGSNETDEFKDQAMELYTAWKSNHDRLELLNIPGKNHYSILDAVTEKGSSLQAAIFNMLMMQ